MIAPSSPRQQFLYQKFAWQLKDSRFETTFHYQTPTHRFTHHISFNFPLPIQKLPHQALDNLVFHLGLAEIPSYWKTSALPHIHIACGHLSSGQTKFWHKLLVKGLGEFFYQNKIDFTNKNFLHLSSAPNPSFKPSKTKLKNNFLIPVGGGKDSCVTLDSFLHLKKTLTALKVETTNPLPAIDAVIKASRLTQTISVKRTLDPKILKPKDNNFLQGHIPFSASLAFISTTAAILSGNKYIPLSNEASSNQGNVSYLGHEINHQYSKTFEFEKDFHHYSRRHLHRQVYYFSFLRPLNELQICQAFALLPHYHSVFISCNKGQKDASWCGQCPKCLSTYLMLAPFAKDLSFISHQNLIKKKSLQPLLNELLGKTNQKPFECVATFEETQAALDLLSHKTKNAARLIRLLTAPNPNHLIPQAFLGQAGLLLKPHTTPLIPVSKVLILGFGREGQSSLKYLLKHYPQTDITIADQNSQIPQILSSLFPKQAKNIKVITGATYLDKLKRFQLIFKSPGISHLKLESQNLDSTQTIITSQTKLFFELSRGTIIGVTGTKGKSTTTALIHHLLQKNGLPAKLLGNIGLPALDYLKQNSPETIYCFELSSHQLHDLHQSPHIAVLQDISPEHLDYYHDFHEYAQAKLNISRFQHFQDHLIYNADKAWPQKAAGLSLARIHPFKGLLPPFLKQTDIPLKGGANYQNVWPAVIVSRLFGLKQDQIKAAIKSFTPLNHRLQVVAIKNGLTFVDDSLSTTPVATIAALDAYPDTTTLLLGGADRNQEFDKLIKPLQASRVQTIILFPPTGEKIRKALQDHLKNISFFPVASMNQAIKLVRRHTPKNSTVLLSPAAPSFGIFKDYTDRANQFIFWIENFK